MLIYGLSHFSVPCLSGLVEAPERKHSSHQRESDLFCLALSRLYLAPVIHWLRPIKYHSKCISIPSCVYIPCQCYSGTRRKMIFRSIPQWYMGNRTWKGVRVQSESGGGYLHNPLSRQTSLCSPPLFFLPPAHPSFFVFFVLFLQVVDYHFVRWFHRVGERVS